MVNDVKAICFREPHPVFCLGEGAVQESGSQGAWDWIPAFAGRGDIRPHVEFSNDATSQGREIQWARSPPV